MPQAQLVETRIINLLHFESIIASKAARCILAAQGKASLIDFGLRRAHAAEAGLLAARAACATGFSGTATVLAGALYGIPIFGTMAHSYIEAFGNEEDAFVAYARANPGNVTFLIDTYDTLSGARHAANAAKKLAGEGIRTHAVRLDSGEFCALSKEVRALLDGQGLRDVRIFVSGNIDEYSIRQLLLAGAPIDAFGVGTKLDTSSDAPYLECAYKLVEYAGIPRLKTSTGKATLPGRKQVFRRVRDGLIAGDTITLVGDEQEGLPLVERVMEKGRRLSPSPDLASVSLYTGSQLKSLPDNLRQLGIDPPYDVRISPLLRRLQEETMRLHG